MRNLILILAFLIAATDSHSAVKSAKQRKATEKASYADSTADTVSALNAIDSLGNNKQLVERAKAIDGDNKVRVVQNRIVNRNMRLELGVNYGLVSGGDAYLNTQNLGFMGDFHLIPQISVGVRYQEYYNELSAQGKRVFDDAQKKGNAGEPYTKPDVDYPLSSTMGIITVYPLYGKLNFFNLGVTQFDVYALGGYGTMRLGSGNTSAWTAGGGIGVWWTNLISSRIEIRHQAYEDKIITGTRQQGVTQFSAGIGFML